MKSITTKSTYKYRGIIATRGITQAPPKLAGRWHAAFQIQTTAGIWPNGGLSAVLSPKKSHEPPRHRQRRPVYPGVQGDIDTNRGIQSP